MVVNSGTQAVKESYFVEQADELKGRYKEIHYVPSVLPSETLNFLEKPVTLDKFKGCAAPKLIQFYIHIWYGDCTTSQAKDELITDLAR
jgi:hypothetical protein